MNVLVIPVPGHADIAMSYVVMAQDRDQARRTQRERPHRSLHDELTGLPNRALLFDRLEHALTVAARHEQTIAVFFIDLDRFKQILNPFKQIINDTFGHAGGDGALAQATTRLAEALRQEDTLARLAGGVALSGSGSTCDDLLAEADVAMSRPSSNAATSS